MPDLSQPEAVVPPAAVVAGLPETRIREIWPSVAAWPAVAGLGRVLTNTLLLAPLGWLLMSAVYFGKLLPFAARRYTLTNKRLMIRAGWAGAITQEVALTDIDDVRRAMDANSEFFRAANLEIVRGGQVVMTLAGVPDPEPFRHTILNARNAWAPGKAQTLPFIPASATK